MSDGPFRSCVACRRVDEQDALVRFVVADGTVRVDPRRRRPGRGAYVCRRPECLDAALRRHGARLTRALRAERGRARVDEARLRTGWRAASVRVRTGEARPERE